jgi:hypothetical protein
MPATNTRRVAGSLLFALVCVAALTLTCAISDATRRVFHKDPEDDKGKFILASSGGGTRAFFGFYAAIAGYKSDSQDDALSGVLRDADFITTNSGSSWFMNRILLDETFEVSHKWLKNVHDQMHGNDDIDERKKEYLKLVNEQQYRGRFIDQERRGHNKKTGIHKLVLLGVLEQAADFFLEKQKLQAVPMVVNFLEAHLLRVLEEDQRDWKDFVKKRVMNFEQPKQRSKKVKERKTVWHQQVALALDGTLFRTPNGNKQLWSYRIHCDKCKNVGNVPVYVTVETEHDRVTVQIPFFDNDDKYTVRFEKMHTERQDVKEIFHEVFTDDGEKTSGCKLQAMKWREMQDDDVEMTGEDLISFFQGHFSTLWEEDPTAMSTASSAFAGMMASLDLFNKFPFLGVHESKSVNLSLFESIAHRTILSFFNEIGNGMTSLMTNRAESAYSFNFPNPHMADRATSSLPQFKKLEFSLIDGSYSDNTGIAASVYMGQQKYGTNDIPRIYALLHPTTIDGAIQGVEKLFEIETLKNTDQKRVEYKLHPLTFHNTAIFEGAIELPDGFVEECKEKRERYILNKAASGTDAFCSVSVIAKTIQNDYFGIRAGNTISMQLILPISFNALPSIAVAGKTYEDEFQRAFDAIKTVNVLTTDLKAKTVNVLTTDLKAKRIKKKWLWSKIKLGAKGTLGIAIKPFKSLPAKLFKRLLAKLEGKTCKQRYKFEKTRTIMKTLKKYILKNSYFQAIFKHRAEFLNFLALTKEFTNFCHYEQEQEQKYDFAIREITEKITSKFGPDVIDYLFNTPCITDDAFCKMLMMIRKDVEKRECRGEMAALVSNMANIFWTHTVWHERLPSEIVELERKALSMMNRRWRSNSKKKGGKRKFL